MLAIISEDCDLKNLSLGSDNNTIKMATSGRSICLTARETQCLYFLCKGFRAKEIAKKLVLSPRTVETYLDKIRFKMNCRSRIELISKLDYQYIRKLETVMADSK